MLENFDEQSESLMADALDVAYDVFGVDDNLVDNFIIRFSALMDCIENPELSAFSLFLDEQIKLHPALLHAAAECSVNRNGKFKRNKFAEMVASLRTRKYPDWEFPSVDRQ